MKFTSEQIVASIDLHFSRCSYLNDRQLTYHQVQLWCPECMPGPVAVLTPVAEKVLA